MDSNNIVFAKNTIQANTVIGVVDGTICSIGDIDPFSKKIIYIDPDYVINMTKSNSICSFIDYADNEEDSNVHVVCNVECNAVKNCVFKTKRSINPCEKILLSVYVEFSMLS